MGCVRETPQIKMKASTGCVRETRRWAAVRDIQVNVSLTNCEKDSCAEIKSAAPRSVVSPVSAQPVFEPEDSAGKRCSAGSVAASVEGTGPRPQPLR